MASFTAALKQWVIDTYQTKMGADDNYVTDAEKAALHSHPAVIAQGATQADARAAIGAGTSNLAIGTTAGTAKEGNYAPPNASTTVAGIVELATTAGATTGTDTTRATTPAGVKAALDAKAASDMATYAPRHASGIGRHFHLREMSQRSKGGAIGTSGKPTIAFRVDHGAQQFLSTYWPIFKAAGIPVSYGVVTDSHELGMNSPYEPTSYTWADLKAAWKQGFEIWSHSRSHLAPAPERPGGYTIEQETVGSKALIEAQGIRVAGYQGAGVPGLTTPDYSNNFSQTTSWDSEHGHLLLANYGLINTGGEKIGGSVRAIPMGGNLYSYDRYTIDALTLAAVQDLIETNVMRDGLSIELMMHGRLARASWETDLPILLADIAAKWTNGDLEVLTVAGQCWATPATGRFSLVRNGSFERSNSFATSTWLSGGGTGTLTVETDGGHTGPNYLHIPAAASYTYAYQSSAQISSLSMRGATVMVEAWVRCTGSNTEARFVVHDNTDNTRLYFEHYKMITAGAGWVRMWTVFTIPVETTQLQLRCNRRNGGGDIDFDDVRITPI